MIPLECRQKGAAALGARHPREQGPFGVRPDEDDDQDDGQPDDGAAACHRLRSSTGGRPTRRST